MPLGRYPFIRSMDRNKILTKIKPVTVCDCVCSNWRLDALAAEHGIGMQFDGISLKGEDSLITNFGMIS